MDGEPGKKEPSLDKEKLEEEGLLTEEEIINVLDEKLDFEKTEAQPLVDKETDKAPSAYRLKDETGKLFIYVFESIEERYKVFPSDFSDTHAPGDNDAGIFSFFSFNAQNATIAFQMKDAAEKRMDGFRNHHQISQVVFRELNDIREETYKGKGDLWKVELNATYFDYELENEVEKRINYGELIFDVEFLEEDFEQLRYLGVLYKYGVTPSDYATPSDYSKTGAVDVEKKDSLPVLNENGKRTLETTKDELPDDLGEEKVEVIVKWGEEAFEERESIVLKRE